MVDSIHMSVHGSSMHGVSRRFIYLELLGRAQVFVPESQYNHTIITCYSHRGDPLTLRSRPIIQAPHGRVSP